MKQLIKLPKPNEKGALSVEEALYRRRSERGYKKGALTLQQVSQLLWASSGRNLHRRTAPSAGATYPLEIYLVVGEVEDLEKGVYHYTPSVHALERMKGEEVRDRLSGASLGQRMIEKAPINLIVAADYGRTTRHYGQRGLRYVHMEVGHVGQNVSLQAIALGLGTVMVGAFEDREVKEVLGIDEEPLYIIPVGRI